MKTALSFDDVLLLPQYNEVVSRKDVNTGTQLSKHLTLKIPVISSCMDTVTEDKMAIAMWRAGGLGILHRYNTIGQQLDMFRKVKIGKMPGEELMLFDRDPAANCAIAIGATGDYLDRALTLYDHAADIFCVDVAHGDSKIVIEAVKAIRRRLPNITLIAGNVATGEGCEHLINAGADAVRCGIGGGSLCTTRVATGHGVPTFQTIMDCREHLDANGYGSRAVLLADGGIKNSGDLTKALAAGASAVILGQLLAATTEAPGEIITERVDHDYGTDFYKYKRYRGMASKAAQLDWRPDKKDEIVPEGETTRLPYKGDVVPMLYQLVGGLRSGMTYSGASTISELQKKAKWIQITNAGWIESKPHAKKE